MLHTLRWLIGDAAWRKSVRLIVYGRADPRPGNFAPRYASTADYERDVKAVTGRDYGWFFNVYLRQAALPELIQTRTGRGIRLRWRVPGDGPFPLPIEIAIDGRITRVPMTGGRGFVPAPAGARVLVDPMARVLRRSIAVEEYQAWQTEQRAAAAKAKP